MKKTLQPSTVMLFLTLQLSVIAQTSSAQDNKEKKTAKSYIEISAGISAPFGHFAKTDYSDLRSGFASAGPVIAISGVKYIAHSNFGLGGTLSYASYGVNGQNLALGYQKTFEVDSVNEHNTKYTSIHALVGPYYSIPLGIVTIDFHALAGVNAMWSPAIDVLLEDGGNSNYNGGTKYTFWQESASDVSLAMQLGAGIRVTPVKHFSIAVRVDYFYSRPVFNLNMQYLIPNAYPGERYLTSYSQAFNGVNASLGLVYEFGK